MNYIKNNKILLLKYLVIMILNILTYIIINFYFNHTEYKTIFMLFVTLILNLIIYYYKEKTKFNYILDYIVNILVGIIFMFIIEDFYVYMITVFSIVLANNIVFMRSRLNPNFIKRTLQYIFILVNTIICFSINLSIIFYI